jgi:hypothetical protein
VAERKPFLLRIESDLYAALARWADDELRSLNGQIEFLLRGTLEGAGRLPRVAVRQPREARREPVAPKQVAPKPAAPKPAAPRPVPERPAVPISALERPTVQKPAGDWDAMED